jgi:hypothetical protein
MPETISFPAVTPRFGLPLLFAGQSQKEFFVNQSLVLIDMLLQPSAVASLETPPPEVADGAVFRIIGPATGLWSGREGQLAYRVAGNWQFIQPITGMRIYDHAEDQWLHFSSNDEWLGAELPSEAQGGTVVDSEARALLTQVIDALSTLGLVKITQA